MRRVRVRASRQLLSRTRDLEQVLRTQLLCNTTASVPPGRRVSALLNLSERRAISKLSCIVLYCIVLYCIVLYCIVLYCFVPNSTLEKGDRPWTTYRRACFSVQ